MRGFRTGRSDRDGGPRWLLLGALLALVLGGAVPASAQPMRISIDIETAGETDVALAGSTYRAVLDATLSPSGRGLHINSEAPLEDFLIPTVLTLDPPEGIALDGVAWPEPLLLEQQGAEKPLAVFEEEFVIGASFELVGDLAPGDYVLPGTLRYQACDERMCYIPATAEVSFLVRIAPAGTSPAPSAPAALFAGMTFTDPPDPPVPAAAAAGAAPIDGIPIDGEAALTRFGRFDVLATAGGYLNEEQFLDFIQRAETGEAERGWFEGRGPLAILALILLGGLALNLTPCVLPMIPINLAIIGAGARASSRWRGFALGSAYGAAMAIVYGGLGLAVILTAGTFGTINASPWFNLGIAVLFVVLGLAMFDVVTIDFSSLQSRLPSGGSGQGSFVLAFGMGAIAALLAGACVAPVVIQVIVFSSNLYGTGVTLALALPFILGVGMAIPWPIAGAGLTALPKPGAWMVRVKQAFGVFILGTAIYYGYLSYGLFSQRWVDPDLVAESVQELIAEGWYPSLDLGLAAAQDEDKPVLLDIWATWCKNCLTMDSTTLKADGVQAALDGYVKVKFQAEDLGTSPAREVMERLEAIGLPAYAILRPGASQAPAPAATND